MEDLQAENNSDKLSDKLMEPKWGTMLIFSIFLHLIIFSTILFFPESIPTRKIRGTVYEVNLVEMPDKRQAWTKAKPRSSISKVKTVSKKAAKAKRISKTKKKKKPAVIAKRTLKKQKKKKPAVIAKRTLKKQKQKKPKKSSSRLLEEAVSKIERKVKAGKGKDPLDQAISRLKTNLKKGDKKGSAGGYAESGIGMMMYRIKVESWIKSNWSYPVALSSRKNLEAVIVIRVKSNGAILKSFFTKRSLNSIFDSSVLKAIERSDPIPPFPQGHLKRSEEFEITFNLNELER